MSACNITGNMCELSVGGGMLVFYANASMVDGCIVDDNVAGRSAGGIYASGSTLHLSSAHIVRNKATNSGGGLNIEDSTLTVEDTVVGQNEAENGGG